MASRYPELPPHNTKNFTDPELTSLYDMVQVFTSRMVNELDLRDQELDGAPIMNIFRVVTISDIGRPQVGNIAFSINQNKFLGYNTTAWVTLA
tara:strand:- start:17 stop:295 length:279 start_codon:yes stop_codon:yes gene_type:complete